MAVEPAPLDVDNLRIIRANVRAFLTRVASAYRATSGRLLDIAPQVHEGARPFFPSTVAVETLDIDPNSGCTYIGDICARNDVLPDGSLIWRILKLGGLVFITVPFNFRIHGPLPDCWRFTEHGLRALLHRFTILELEGVPTPNRPLMPIHYTMVARKPDRPPAPP
ncbi:MAG: methyltransferase [Bacillati bacterium ANGP1]|uniref:Methyltransferase n=1 Tax=Candidatus Segetimicrobium genomatis TaxID=2569760 RepID=A0A537LAF0_9BACT|nr:MAG: methyltransferase [Terrabacteria group bacterium ANGP1]